MASEEFPIYFFHNSDTDVIPSVRESAASGASGFDTAPDIEERSSENTLDNSLRTKDTGRVAYLRACESMGVVPVRRFMDELNGKEMRITHRNLGPYGSKAIATALIVNNTVTMLDLSNNMIGDKGAEYIASAIVEKDLVKSLVLAGNNLASQGAEVLAELLQRSRKLTVLNLSGNKFDDKDCMVIAESLKHNTFLEELDLSHNKLTQQAGVALGETLTINTNLQRLSLNWNLIRRNGAVAMAKGITANQNLKSLDLSWNGIDDTGACAIASGLGTNKHLAEIHLSSNRISDKGLLEIVKVLEKCNLESIDLSRNSFRGCNKAMEILLGLLLHKNVCLKTANIGQIPLNKESLILLAELKQARPDVQIRYGYNTQDSRQAKAPKKINPCDILKDYAATHEINAFQLFRLLGESDEFRVTIPCWEFENGLRKLEMFSEDQIREVINVLDSDKNGVVDYSEFMAVF